MESGLNLLKGCKREISTAGNNFCKGGLVIKKGLLFSSWGLVEPNY